MSADSSCGRAQHADRHLLSKAPGWGAGLPLHPEVRRDRPFPALGADLAAAAHEALTWLERIADAFNTWKAPTNKDKVQRDQMLFQRLGALIDGFYGRATGTTEKLDTILGLVLMSWPSHM